MVLEKIKYNMIKSIPNDYFIESLRYFIRHKKVANFKNPKTFNEKLGYLKLRKIWYSDFEFVRQISC